jgi:hypothetical protein
LEEVKDLTVANMVLQSQARDVEWQQVVVLDQIDGVPSEPRRDTYGYVFNSLKV